MLPGLPPGREGDPSELTLSYSVLALPEGADLLVPQACVSAITSVLVRSDQRGSVESVRRGATSATCVLMPFRASSRSLGIARLRKHF